MRLELYQRLEKNLGPKAAVELCEILNEPAMTFLRVNAARISRDKAVLVSAFGAAFESGA